MAVDGAASTVPLIDRLPATPAQLFWMRVAETPDLTALREKKLGIWRSISWADYGENVRLSAHGMAALGVGGDDVISVLSENRPEWMFCDIAAICIGAIGNGIYTTSAPPQVAYVLQDSRSRVVFVEDEEQLDKVLAVRDDCPELTKIVVIDPTGLREFADPMVITFAEFLSLGAKHRDADPGFVDARVADTNPGDTAILIYTSGTTGQPKAAMITNDNLIFQIYTSRAGTDLSPKDNILSFLPLCHIAERNFALYFPLAHGNITNFAESPETMFDNLREVSPTAIFAPPRLWEKMYSAVTLAVKDATRFQRWAYQRALALGDAVARAGDEGRRPRLALRLLNATFGKLALANVPCVARPQQDEGRAHRRRAGLARPHPLVSGARHSGARGLWPDRRRRASHDDAAGQERPRHLRIAARGGRGSHLPTPVRCSCGGATYLPDISTSPSKPRRRSTPTAGFIPVTWASWSTAGSCASRTALRT